MRNITISALFLLLAACAPKTPAAFSTVDATPSIFPDYTGVTVPQNIAPMNFIIQEQADAFITVLKAGSEQVSIRGREVRIPLSEWRKLTAAQQITVQVFTRNDGKWSAFVPFSMTVSDEIDPYISYRIIMPSVESYERLSINQRDLTSFKEKVIYANQMVQETDHGQCINCHHYRNYATDNMQFHARQYLGGTIMVIDGKLRKVNLKTDSTISAGVYPAWHPTHDYIAYSTNKTHQSIHSIDPNRIEVTDEESDLILYDIKNNAVSIIENDSAEFECFPALSPDGRTLYYVSAHYEAPFNSNRKDRVFLDSRQIRYDLYRKSFDPDTRTWGKAEMVFNASAQGKSVTLPRISPDGRLLMFAVAPYGVFHIWHREADLWLMDLETGAVTVPLELNSPEVESYHSWSSNGRWVIFSTRREDGAFTRLYLAHLNADGTFSKPFALPQKDPSFNRAFMYSFNIPEFMKEPVRISPKEFASFIAGAETTPAKFESKIGQ